MSLNGDSPRREKIRAEIDELIAEFFRNGGVVQRDRGQRANLFCSVCHYRLRVPARWALNGVHCRRCGSDAVRVTW
jgi:hypothetical protein